MSKQKIPTPFDIEQEYGSRRAAAAALELTTQAIGYWFKVGRIPRTSYRKLASARPRKWGHLRAMAP